jgi:hypothetical protein
MDADKRRQLLVALAFVLVLGSIPALAVLSLLPPPPATADVWIANASEQAEQQAGSGQQPLFPLFERMTFCIANRADTQEHVALALAAVCQLLANRTAHGDLELTCDPWGEGRCVRAPGSSVDEPPHCPPPECGGEWDRADWVFSTFHSLVGECEQSPHLLHGRSSTSAAQQVRWSDLPSLEPAPKLICAVGVGRNLAPSGRAGEGWTDFLCVFFLLGVLRSLLVTTYRCAWCSPTPRYVERIEPPAPYHHPADGQPHTLPQRVRPLPDSVRLPQIVTEN